MSEFKVGDKVYCDLFEGECTVTQVEGNVVTVKWADSEGATISLIQHNFKLVAPKLPVKHGWLNYKGGTYA